MNAAGFRIRRGFERIVGPRLMPYLLHLRPLEWPIMTAHFLLGALLAGGWHLPLRASLLGWLVFVILMNGGTLAINSAFDQDEGDIGYLKAPPKPPERLLAFSIVLLAASAALGWLLPRPFFWINLTCIAMSILYSVPPVRLKARAGWDLLINCLGFGMLTPLAGWALTGRPFTAGILAVSLAFASLFATLYPMTQIYQVDEDRQRGDRTLVIRLGIGSSLGLATGSMLLAHLGFAWGALQLHRAPWGMLVSLGAWLAVLIPWMARGRHWSRDQHEAGMYRGLVAWAVTDLSLLILLWP